MEKHKIINVARSKKNGIVFYSNIFPFIGSETFLDDSGNIYTRLIPTHIDEVIDTFGTINETQTKPRKRIWIIFNIIIILLSMVAFVFSMNFSFLMASIYFSIFVSRDLFKLGCLSYEMKSKKGKERSTARFHAAEHMALEAYEKLQRIPTLEECKNFSRFSKTCGSMKNFPSICMFSMITLAMVLFSGLEYLISLLFIFLFMTVTIRNGWLALLQIFITSKPSDKELSLAIEGIKQFEIMEESIINRNISIELLKMFKYSEEMIYFLRK